MKFTPTKIHGSYIIDLQKIEDERGFFARAFCTDEFAQYGLETNFPQINMSFNHKKGTIRGLHFQTAPHEEVKLVRCINGEIFNVIIDLRPESETYLNWFGVLLSADNHKMLYVPKGCANGYQALIDGAKAFYATSSKYAPEAENGIRWNDPKFKIEWPISEVIVSKKDAGFSDFEGR